MGNSVLHKTVYPNVMAEFREAFLDKMARPKEVLVVVDDNGEAVE